MLKMCRLVVTGVIISTLFGFLNSEDTSCSKVKDEFVKISGEDFVPDFPIIDEELRICSRSLTAQQASCCSRDSELKYLLASEQYLMANIHSKNSFLKTIVTNHSVDYQGKVLALVHHSRNRTSTKLTDWYSIPSLEHRAIEKLFTDIENYVKLGNVIVKNSVDTFFDDIFPVIFKHVIYRQPSSTWSHHYHHCLSRKRQEIQPSPFGKYPEEIAKNLNTGLSLARAYLGALSIVEETIETMDHYLLEDECKHAVTRMQYCSHCKGFINVKPCKGFCLDVMQGCLVKMAEIGPDWNDIISSIEGMVPRMTKKSMSEIFKELDVGIADAIMHAMIAASDFYQNVHDLCGIPLDNPEGSREQRNPDFSKNTGLQREVSGPLAMEIMEAILQLVNYKGLYWNLAGDICKQSDQFEQDPLSGTCWNGSAVSVYVQDVADLDILSQARNNKEVKVSLMLDPHMRNLKDKISVANLNLQAYTRKTNRQSKPKNEMISDGPYGTLSNWGVYEGSADESERPIGNINIGKGSTLQDDEDLYEDYEVVSGSGSGDDEINVVVEKGVDIVLTPQPSYEVDQGGNLGPERPPPRNKNPHQSKPQVDSENGVRQMGASFLPLLLSLVLCIYNIRR